MRRIVGPQGCVVAVDIDPDLVDAAARHLADAGVDDVDLVCADGAFGHPPGAPYDRIVLTVGSGDVRPDWTAQLAPGGRLLLPLAIRGTQLSVALDLGADGVLRSASVNRCAFVRLRGTGAALPERGVTVDGVSVLPADDRDLAPEALRTALSVPGGARPGPVRLGLGDLWDGFGLWLALTEPQTCRLVVPRTDQDDADADADVHGVVALLRLGPGGATVGLLAGDADRPGLAALVLDVADSRGPWPVRVQAFGPGGDAAADRLLASAGAWADAGRPTSEDLRLTVVPRGLATPAVPATTVVEKEHCSVLVALRQA
jgi:protein-L-isoaspartate(D-aspartate) O-methyltransferase